MKKRTSNPSPEITIKLNKIMNKPIMDDQDAYRAEITRLKQSNDELLSALQRVNKDTNCHFGITDLDEA